MVQGVLHAAGAHVPAAVDHVPVAAVLVPHCRAQGSSYT